jgi:HK97 family phage portal protein
MSWIDRARYAMGRWATRSSEALSAADIPWLSRFALAFGETISEQNALRVATAYACIRIIAETIATLPLVLMQEDKHGQKRVAWNEPEYQLWRIAANDHQTAVDFIETTMISILIKGDFFIWTPRNDDGLVDSLWHVPAENIDVKRDGVRAKYFGRTTDGKSLPLELGDDLVHCKAFSIDGLRGLGVLSNHARTLNLSLSQEEYTANMYKTGVMSRGMLETDTPLERREVKELEKQWLKSYGGAANAGKTIVLPFAAKYKPISITPEEAQMIQVFNYQERQICKIFRVPLHMVGNLEKSAFTNIEQQSTDFVRNTLAAWCVRIESALNAFMLTPYQRKKGYYYKFKMQALERGITTDRYKSYGLALTNRWMTPNEVRELEDMNPKEGGDEFNPAPNASVNGANNGQNDGENGDNSAKNEQDPAENTQEKPKKPKKKKNKADLNRAENALFEGIIDAFARAEAKELKFFERELAKAQSDEAYKTTAIRFYQDHAKYLKNVVAPNLRRSALGCGVDTEGQERLDTWLDGYCRQIACDRSLGDKKTPTEYAEGCLEPLTYEVV